MTAQRWPEDVGSVADEAGRLLESLRRAGADAAASSFPHAREEPSAGEPPPQQGTDDGPRHSAPGSGFSCEDPVCQWCPLCRASAFVRQMSPETLTGLAELAGFAASVLTDLASSRAHAEPPDEATSAGAAAGDPEEDRA